jgi:hypothetical protein
MRKKGYQRSRSDFSNLLAAKGLQIAWAPKRVLSPIALNVG